MKLGKGIRGHWRPVRVHKKNGRVSRGLPGRTQSRSRSHDSTTYWLCLGLVAHSPNPNAIKEYLPKRRKKQCSTEEKNLKWAYRNSRVEFKRYAKRGDCRLQAEYLLLTVEFETLLLHEHTTQQRTQQPTTFSGDHQETC